MFKRIILLTILVFLTLIHTSSILSAGELVPISPKVFKNYTVQHRISNPPFRIPTDDYFELNHTDNEADYYMAPSDEADTFFVVFEPLAACSVIYAEIQWYTAGEVNAFAALYSEEAKISFPSGQAPPAGSTDISPVGEFLTDIMPNTVTGSYDWEYLDIGEGFSLGDPATLQPEMFGIGLIKNENNPIPLADDAGSYGCVYTWFGGPYTSTYPHTWGSYIQFAVEEMMLRVWVSYPFAMNMGIMISDVYEKSDTYNFTGPYEITCTLTPDSPITPEDITELKYTVNDGDTFSVQLEDIPPLGDDIYAASIEGDFSVDDEIRYWIYTHQNSSGIMRTSPRYYFDILEPDHPNAELLFIYENLDGYEFHAWYEFFSSHLPNFSTEYWSVEEHNGIDESVVNWGWETVFLMGWGCSVIPALDEPNVFSSFLDEGGDLFYSDQDYFFANNLPSEGTFEPGDFAYEYFGIVDYWNDPETPDTSYLGEYWDPVSSSFAEDPYITYYELSTNIWCDYFTTGSEEIFYGFEGGNVYGCRHEEGDMKTVYLGFNVWWGCDIDTGGYYHASAQFQTLIDDIVEYLDIHPGEVEDVSVTGIPNKFEFYPPYPNPFNQRTALDFVLPSAGIIRLAVYDINGREIAVLVDDYKVKGSHEVVFDAEGLSSGLYFVRLETDRFSEAKKVLLLK